MTMNSPTGLTFEAGPHIYKFQGNPVPSVTGILDPYSGLEFVDAEVLRVTAEFGNHVHSACHLHDTGALNRIGLSPAIEAHLTAWERFLADTGAVVLYSGTRVYSSKLGYAGTLDKIVRWGESNRIIDIKTGSVLPKTVGPANLWLCPRVAGNDIRTADATLLRPP